VYDQPGGAGADAGQRSMPAPVGRQQSTGSALVGETIESAGLSALDVLPIVAAPASVVVMIATIVIKPADAYEADQWERIFLIAGVIPLGKALSATGGADLLPRASASGADRLPRALVLGLIYLLTALISNLISNWAPGVPLRPVAVDGEEDGHTQEEH